MSWVWPESLVQEVAERRVAFVLGAGASMSSVNSTGQRPPSWQSLIGRLQVAVADRAASRSVGALLRKGRLLEAAEVIEDCLPGNELAHILRSSLQTPNFLPSELHKTLIAIDPKVTVTTNYDAIFERACGDQIGDAAFVVCRHTDTHAVNDLRSGQRCIFKMHGCISDPGNIVLSKTSYFRARRDYPQFYKVLDSIFLTHTLIFVGSSIEDPDIQLLLENANISAPSGHPHFAILERPSHAISEKIMSENYNVRVIPYKKAGHEEVIILLKELSELVDQWRSVH